MTYEEILREFAALPPEGQERAAEFISSLREYYAREGGNSGHGRVDLGSLGFFGMWRDRADMQNASQWLRKHREHEWVK